MTDTHKLQVEISTDTYRELLRISELHHRYGAPNPQDTVADLVRYVLASVADGSRRPGSWERQMLEMMGLVADCDAHHEYREGYGITDADGLGDDPVIAIVALEDGTTGKVDWEPVEGDTVTVRLNDENGNPIRHTGVVVEVLYTAR